MYLKAEREAGVKRIRWVISVRRCNSSKNGGLILLGDGDFTVGAQPLVTEPVTVVGRCSSGSNIGGQVGGHWNVNGFGENAHMRLAGLRLEMGLKASNLKPKTQSSDHESRNRAAKPAWH